jgi:hypothetical protein
MQFFNPSAQMRFDPNDPQGFNYNAAAEDIKRKQQLAELLGQFKVRQGGVTNAGGFYAGGANWGDALAKALTGYMSGKAAHAATEDKKALEKSSADAYAEALKRLKTPSAEEQELINNPSIYQYRNPAEVGPPAEMAGIRPDVAQSFPVAPQTPPVSGPQMLPVQPTQQQIVQQQRAARPATATPGAQISPTFDPRMSDPDYVEPIDPVREPQAFQMLQRAGAAQAAQAAPTQPAAPQAPAPALPQAVAAQQAPAPHAPRRLEDHFAINEEAAVKTEAERARLRQERILGAQDILNRSGPQGRALLQAMQAAELERLTKGGELAKVQTEQTADGLLERGPDGQWRKVTVGGQPVRTQAQETRDAAIAKREGDQREERKNLEALVARNAGFVENLNALGGSIDLLEGPVDALQAWAGNLLNVATDAGDARRRLESVRGQALALGMEASKQQAGTAAGLSQMESQALQAAIASLQTSTSPQESLRQIQNIYRIVNNQMSGAQRRLAELNGGGAQADAPTTSGIARMPARGETLRP